jgi:hypothetical protein
MICITTPIAAAAVVEFPYDEEAVQIIRTIPGRRWNATQKHWTVPGDGFRLLAPRMHTHGFTVTVDGRPFTRTPAPTGISPTSSPPSPASPQTTGTRRRSCTHSTSKLLEFHAVLVLGMDLDEGPQREGEGRDTT